jgi:tetratricopeptide (TPR) repeat protein
VDLLTSLVDKSLVVYMPPSDSGGVLQGANPTGRYRLLETVRKFAAERLTDTGLRETVMSRHRDFYRAWSQEGEKHLSGPDAAYWFDRFEVEHDNLRAAIAWCRHQGDLEEERRLVTTLARFWDTHGHLSEGRAYLESCLSRMTSAVPAVLRANLASQAGWAALAHADYGAARRHYQECLAINRADESPRPEGDVLNYLACIAVQEGRLEEAQALFEQSLSIARSAARPGALASVLNNMAEFENQRGDLVSAEAHLTESASLCEAHGARQLLGIVYGNLSVTALRSGRFHDAEVHCIASIRTLWEVGAFVNLPDTLRRLGIISVELGVPERGAWMLGAAAAHAETLEIPSRDFSSRVVTHAAVAARNALGTEEFDVLYNCGKALSLEQAVQYALRAD